jgi:hypothetical protein
MTGSRPAQLRSAANAENPWWYDNLELDYPSGTEPGDVALLATTLPYGESVIPTGYCIVDTENGCTVTGYVYTVVYDHVVAAGDTAGDVELPDGATSRSSRRRSPRLQRFE